MKMIIFSMLCKMLSSAEVGDDVLIFIFFSLGVHYSAECICNRSMPRSRAKTTGSTSSIQRQQQLAEHATAANVRGGRIFHRAFTNNNVQSESGKRRWNER